MSEPTKPIQQPLSTAPTPAPAKAAPVPVAEPPAILSQLQKRVDTIGTFLKAREAEITKDVVGGLTSKRLIGLLLSEMQRNPQLANCTPESVYHAAKRMAQAGLEPGPFGHAYPVPFANKDKGVTEMQCIFGWRGLAFAATRARAALDVDGEVVVDGDEFEFWKGTEGDFLKHRATSDKPRDEANMIGAYCVVTLPDGRRKAWFMKKADILRRKQASLTKGGDIWNKWPDDMFVKTVVRHSMKFLPLSHLSPTERDTLSRVYVSEDDAETVNDADVVAVTDAPKPTTTAEKALARVAEIHPETKNTEG